MTLIELAECTGYACPPGNKVPASEVIVKTFTDTLATTGGTDMTGWVVAGLLAVSTGLLFLYNHITRNDRRDND